MPNAEKPSSHEFIFEVGQVVSHLRYAYRGVIFDRNTNCRATQSWYEHNQSQPDRDQPWYHLLVDGQAHTTYVAQSNLEADQSSEAVEHPMLDQFFNSYHNHHYYKQHLN